MVKGCWIGCNAVSDRFRYQPVEDLVEHRNLSLSWSRSEIWSSARLLRNTSHSWREGKWQALSFRQSWEDYMGECVHKYDEDLL